jgi:hypothetical protein
MDVEKLDRPSYEALAAVRNPTEERSNDEPLRLGALRRRDLAHLLHVYEIANARSRSESSSPACGGW